MDKAFKALWIEALRSGEYEQTRDILRDEKGYCCFGVAANLLCPFGWERTPYGWQWIAACNQETLGSITTEKFGVSYRQRVSLKNMNDDGITFDQIADWIELNL